MHTADAKAAGAATVDPISRSTKERHDTTLLIRTCFMVLPSLRYDTHRLIILSSISLSIYRNSVCANTKVYCINAWSLILML
jgi:hypothetical protein